MTRGIRNEISLDFFSTSHNASDKSRSIFMDYVTNETIFKDKTPLHLKYAPKQINHRIKEIQTISHILKPCLKLEKPSNIFMYGQPGTGKTLTIKHVLNMLNDVTGEIKKPVKTLYINCRLGGVADTDYRLLARICSLLGREVPKTGLATKDVYDVFYNVIDKEQTIVIVLDEIDNLINKKGSSILYNLSRIDDELEYAKLSFIGISNDTSFIKNLDSRVKSSLTEEQVIFEPYNATQIYDILKERAQISLKDGVCSEGILRMISAMTAKENGDIRRALNLLRVSSELTERKGQQQITEDIIKEAEEKIEVDATEKTIKSLPKQTKVLLYSIIKMNEKEQSIHTGDIYERYTYFSNKFGETTLTKRRISGLISDLDVMGVLNTKVISKGRRGRTKKTTLNIDPVMVDRVFHILEYELNM